jgi:BMFP domain-containing protein YqiC
MSFNHWVAILALRCSNASDASTHRRGAGFGRVARQRCERRCRPSSISGKALIPTAERLLRPTLLDSTASLAESRFHPTPVHHRESHPMFQSKALDDLAARIGVAIENSPAKDVEKNIKLMLGAGLARLDLVPRAEFDVQAAVLLKTREKIDALEKRLAAIEARLPPGG